MTRMIELTDLMEDDHVETVRVERVAATIRRWFGGRGVMLTADADMIDELQEALLVQDYAEARAISDEIAVGFDEV